jgi:RNA polymerase sigma factor (sigma-70 family)
VRLILSSKKGAETAVKDNEWAVLQSNILNAYYADNARKLHRVVDRILHKFGGLLDKDKEDFYSLANEVFVDVLKRFDYQQSFDGFLYSCLSNKIKTEITRRNREKRRADRMSVPLDAVNDSGEEYSLLDYIPSDFDTFEEASKLQKNGQYRDKVQQYISKLSNSQVNILNLLLDGYKPNEIQRILGMPPTRYLENLKTMRSYENVNILF